MKGKQIRAGEGREVGGSLWLGGLFGFVGDFLGVLDVLDVLGVLGGWGNVQVAHQGLPTHIIHPILAIWLIQWRMAL